jgi:hypothetical protein
MRIQGLIAGTAASVLVVAMGAIAAIASHMSGSKAGGDDERAVPVAVASRPLDRGCRDCGVVVAVRPIELKAKTASMRYQIRVRMSDGSVKTLTSSTQPSWKAGDRVRLQNGRLAG